jgi:hypothetical protein
MDPTVLHDGVVGDPARWRAMHGPDVCHEGLAIAEGRSLDVAPVRWIVTVPGTTW